jgi:hypothetical protein
MFPLTDQGILTKECEELIGISTDMALKDTHANVSLINWWPEEKDGFPPISSVAVKKLRPFPYSYMCQTAFSRYPATGGIHRNRSNADYDTRI